MKWSDDLPWHLLSDIDYQEAKMENDTQQHPIDPAVEKVVRKQSFDEACWELAEHFYPKATEAQLNQLAQEIQDVVESAGIELP